MPTENDVSNPMPVWVRHMSRRPVMVLGHGRSGTSILQGMLRKYLRVAAGTESQFIPRYFYRLGTYGDLNDDANLRRLLSDIIRERWFARTRQHGLRTSAEELFERVQVRTFRGVLDTIFGELARQTGMSRWSDKTPDYVFHLPVLKSIFPDAKFVHIVRDGRDVALSAFEMFWGPKNVTSAALEWNHTVQLVRDFQREVPEEQFIEVRYEDLLDKPAEVFGRFIEFLEIDDSNGAVLASIDQNIRADLKAGNYAKWKRALTRGQIERFDRISGDLLRAYGYETSDVTSVHVSKLEAAYWELDSRIRRLLRPDYWRDNAYKARIRSRDLARRIGLQPEPNEKLDRLERQIEWSILGENGAGI